MFNSSNIILRFGVASDIHVSGSWNQPRSRAKWAHVIDTFTKTAGYAEDGTPLLDGILINGDFIDAINSPGNVQNMERYGNKITQNVCELGHVNDCLLGRNRGGVGEGLDERIRFFYALGNHDGTKNGRTSYNTERYPYPAMHSAAIFAAVFTGWKCRDFSEDSTEFEDYFEDLTSLYENDSEAGRKAFSEKYEVDASEALRLYGYHYGKDIDLTGEHALMYGNRHTKLGDIHFAAIDVACSPESAAYLERICAESVAEDPDMPIFVMTHYHIKDTVSISADGTDKLDEVLLKYPQIMIFGGHTHTSLFLESGIDDRKNATAVDSSVGAYLSTTSLLGLHGEVGYPHNLPRKEVHSFGNGLYIEVDGGYNIRVNRIDLYRSFSTLYAGDDIYRGIGEFDDYVKQSGGEPTDKAVFIREPWIVVPPSKRNGHEFTPARGEGFAPPVFKKDAKVTVEKLEEGIKLTFDAASCDDMVFLYNVTFSGVGEDKSFGLTSGFIDKTEVSQMAPTLSDVFPEITESGKYTVKVTALDVWMREGESLEAEFEI